jgi:hypothetical protein
MTIEEAFRDSKGCRFGMKMQWTAFTKPERLSRLFLLAAIAMLVWTLAGIMAVAQDPSLRLASKKKGPRRSILAIGVNAVFYIAKVLKARMQLLLAFLAPPTLRSFNPLATVTK